MEVKPPKAYPSDVSDEEWAFVAPYLTLITEEAPQRVYEMREVYNGLRYIARSGAPWRCMPNDLPPWPVVYQQTQRGLRGHNVQVAYVDAGYTGEEAAEAAECQERLYLVATQVGCGAQFCLGYSLPQVGTRLRAPA